jgi:hypothetical protein
LIQVFVEALDKCFENVCELDFIFHSDRVSYILDEIIMAGMVLETNIAHILAAVSDQNKLHASSIRSMGMGAGSSVSGSGGGLPSSSQMTSAAVQAQKMGGQLLSSLSAYSIMGGGGGGGGRK